MAPKSGALSAHVEAAELGLPVLQPYIAQYTSMTLLKGTVGARLDIERGADGALAVKGGTRVADLRTVDNALKQDFVKWKELARRGRELPLAAGEPAHRQRHGARTVRAHDHRTRPHDQHR